MRGASIAVCLILTACAGAGRGEELPPPQLPERAGVDTLVAARAAGVEFRAVGGGIVIEIFRTDRIQLTLAETGAVLVFPKPAPLLPRWNGSIYETANADHALRVEIRNYLPCATPDRGLYPTAVNVRLDDREFAACGRAT